MARYTLNIGMDYSTSGGESTGRWAKADVEAAVRDWLGHDDFDAAFYVQDGYPKAVVEFKEWGLGVVGSTLCEALHQDYIAWSNTTSYGSKVYVVGPNAHRARPYDPCRFILLRGNALGDNRTFPLYIEPGATFKPKTFSAAVVETVDALGRVRDGLSADTLAAGGMYISTGGGTYNQLRAQPDVEHFFLLKDGMTHISAKLIRAEGEDPWVNICYVPTGTTVMLRRADFKRLVEALEVLP